MFLIKNEYSRFILFINNKLLSLWPNIYMIIMIENEEKEKKEKKKEDTKDTIWGIIILIVIVGIIFLIIRYGFAIILAIGIILALLTGAL
jgi:fatty acid desaturase